MSNKLAVEKIYQKKTQLEHILLRPDTYIGSVERLEQEMWVWDFEQEKMLKKNIKYVPGLFKIFDEIIVNASDNKIRDSGMSVIKVNIDKAQNMIKVYNNGKGIPIVEHKDEKVFVPTLIFGHLLTSSNYNDSEKKVTGGRNGFGAKLCNIFSTKFIVETSCKESKKYFKQTWQSNMNKTADPIIKANKDQDFTCITFYPDLAKFGMDSLEDDTISLLARRAYDIAASTRGVKVYLNDKKLPISKFEDYCKLYVSNNTNEPDFLGSNSQVKILYDNPNPRWEIAISFSDIGFQQVSFVNSIATSKGGRHVDYISDQIVKYLGEVVNKKSGKNSTQVKPFQIKNHIWLFVNCLIENPVFESQTKECMSLQVKNFGSKCQLSEDFLKKIASKSGIVDRVLNWLAFKEKTDLEKTGSKSKQSKVRGIPKLDDANNAGTRDSLNCTLILTEGDSAKTLAVAGLGVLGRDRYGVFPLRGKMLNVREATAKQILENNEITSICKIIGLNFKQKYESKDSLKQLRYGKIMIMTDQDFDGSHIKGLIINFIHHQWPNLLKHGFIEEFITPIIKVSKTNAEKAFYSMPEFEEWQKSTLDWHTWKIKYYKGLGTSTSKEAKEYFSDMNRHCIKFEYTGTRDDLAIQLAFNKKLVEERKDWLTRFMQSRNSQTNNYLYQKDTKKINYSQFINKELVLFSNLDNERSIPSLVDGFKPGQRKVLFACFKRNLQKEIKVAQLAGSVAELSAYHHGEQSLMGTIINLAQNFVGSNNINLLLPIGQFGTRLHGGKDAASPRYIFTNLSPLTRFIFNPKDDPLFNYLNDDGQTVEPEFYCPILPMVLVNG
ncbi:DNA topoisomerase 2-alpha-like, partial [Brachionus plicatilis]